MHAAAFEITVWVCEERYAGAVGVLAASVAQDAGCAAALCTAFAERVDAAVRESLPTVRPERDLAVIVRRRNGPVEVVVDGRTLTLPV